MTRTLPAPAAKPSGRSVLKPTIGTTTLSSAARLKVAKEWPLKDQAQALKKWPGRPKAQAMATAVIMAQADELVDGWASKYLSWPKLIQRRNYPTLLGLYNVWVLDPEEN